MTHGTIGGSWVRRSDDTWVELEPKKDLSDAKTRPHMAEMLRTRRDVMKIPSVVVGLSGLPQATVSYTHNHHVKKPLF